MAISRSYPRHLVYLKYVSLAEDDSEEEDMEIELEPKPIAFAMTSRPPIDIDQLAKQHFDNMIRAKLVTLEPTAEAMLPDAPVVTSKTTQPAPAASPKSSEGGVPTSSNSMINTTPTIYTCDQCDKTFTKKSSITRHKYEHSGKDLTSVLNFITPFSSFSPQVFRQYLQFKEEFLHFDSFFFVKSYKTMLKATFK